MSTLTTKKNSLLSLALAAVLVLLSTLTMASAQPEQAQTERVSFDNIGLRRAVSASLEDSVAAEITYGPIGEWNTAEVTDMSRCVSFYLFFVLHCSLFRVN